jgi:chorismate--pyruvate lyase
VACGGQAVRSLRTAHGDVMPDSHWWPLERVAPQVPGALVSWLAEPGLLTARVRALCGDDLAFRLLGPLREAPLPVSLQARLDVTGPGCLLREIEFCCGARRVIFAQTILPAATVAGFPWLSNLGDAPLGEALREAGQPLDRDPLEYRALRHDHPLAIAAWQSSASSPRATAAARVAGVELWARRAVYRLAGHPILVQEVFLPALLQIEAGA